MKFTSILFNQEIINVENIDQPAFFTDLHLDQVIESIIYPKKEYHLKNYFYLALQSLELIKYRTEVFRDLERIEIAKIIEDFSQKIMNVRNNLKLIDQLDYQYNKKGWHLDTVLIYCDAIIELVTHLASINLHSEGLNLINEYLHSYITTPEFKSLHAQASMVKSELEAIKYCVIIDSGSFSVQKYKEEKDYTVEVAEIFRKFQQQSKNESKTQKIFKTGMNHVEAKILDFVIQLFPEPFHNLDTFYREHPVFVEDLILTFDREIQFYLAYLGFISKIKEKKLSFCYPEISRSKSDIYASNSFDIALANKNLKTEEQIITNDFYLHDPERIIVISGPNQGGKTTFARMFGQLHYLARLGVLVPGTDAKIFLSDNIYTHFEQEESLTTLQGKLQNELIRFKNIFDQLTPNSILIINEIFSSTTLEDGIFIGKEILMKLMELDLFSVIVTFIDEISRLGPQTISMVSTIVPENPASRTFKIVRKQADGLAYAISIAKKHRLTYDQIKERIQL